MDSFARMARSSCNECGSSILTWTDVQALFFLVAPEYRKRVLEAKAFYGSRAEAWKCAKCFAFGVFGPTEYAL